MEYQRSLGPHELISTFETAPSPLALFATPPPERRPLLRRRRSPPTVVLRRLPRARRSPRQRRRHRSPRRHPAPTPPPRRSPHRPPAPTPPSAQTRRRSPQRPQCHRTPQRHRRPPPSSTAASTAATLHNGPCRHLVRARRGIIFILKCFIFVGFLWPTGVNCYVIRFSLNLLIDSVISLHMTLYIVVAIFNFMLQI
jgi:hypothetical protein